MSAGKSWATVYTSSLSGEAHLVRSLLSAEGIEARVQGDALPWTGIPLSHIQVIVSSADRDRAAAVVAAYKEKRAAAARLPGWTCRACGESVSGWHIACTRCGGAQEPEAPDGGNEQGSAP